MPRIGGTLTDLADTGAAMDLAGATALESGARARQVASAIRADVDTIGQTLTTHFGELAAALRHQIAASRARLGSADWHGASRANAEAAEAALHADVDRVLSLALEGVDRLRVELLTRIEGFESHVSTEFSGVLGAVDESYRSLGAATRAFAAQLEAADRTIGFGA